MPDFALNLPNKSPLGVGFCFPSSALIRGHLIYRGQVAHTGLRVRSLFNKQCG